jgi:hypothetical protein
VEDVELSEVSVARAPSPASVHGNVADAERLKRLEDELSDLRKEVADLKQQFASFRKQFE